MHKRKVLILSNSMWSVYNYRRNLIKKILLTQDYEVCVLAPADTSQEKLEDIGCSCFNIAINRKGQNPLSELKLIFEYYNKIKKIGPSVILGFTIKPNIYGNLVAKKLKIPVINNITGLGTVFIKKSIVTQLVKLLYRIAFRNIHMVFFQNADDAELFHKLRLVKNSNFDVLPGSGVDLNHFKPFEKKNQNGTTMFLMIGRLLYDKGISEYVYAAQMLQNKKYDCKCLLLGDVDPCNKTAVQEFELLEWVENGYIEYLGSVDDVRPVIAEADCVVLPSYREGVPRTLLEAGAMAKPLIASDAVGCREAVTDGINGFLCNVKDRDDLAVKMEKFVQLAGPDRIKLGKLSRKKMELDFDENIVLDKYLAQIKNTGNRKDKNMDL